ncbi:MAG TPA: GNAT family protein [Vicinamibacterales bacterium]|nr:GNAT family protein [Vicinamibacterales bacterium]
METMPYRLEPAVRAGSYGAAALPAAVASPADWREGLPVLRALGLTLRELSAADAPSLAAQLTTAQVTRFISPPPTSVAGFVRFITWTHRERAAGRYACFAVVPDGQTVAVGLFQIRRLEDQDGVAEWGFILGEAYWGTGLFLAGAERVVDFAFATMGLHRLEARASTANGRGNGALAKLGAVCEAVLRQSFERQGVWHDQRLWSILRDDWRPRRVSAGGVPRVRGTREWGYRRARLGVSRPSRRAAGARRRR